MLGYKLKTGAPTVPPDNIIGGVALETVGDAGTLYSGYTLSVGDDFNTLDILAPHKPRGKWFTTRTYLSGSRGSDTLLGTMFDTDPFFTGHNDSNRGVPVGYNNLRAEGGAVSMQSRKATAGEQTHMSSVRNEVACMLSGAGAFHWYPDAAGTGDIIYEARLSLSNAASNPAGWHPTFWLQSLTPTLAINSDEWDWEGNAQGMNATQTVWTNSAAVGSVYGTPRANDLQYAVISFVLNTTQVSIYVNGVLYVTRVQSANTKAKPQYSLLTNHVYNGTFVADTYSQAAWNASANGATMQVDWVRVWRRTANTHYKPLTAISDVNVNYGSSVDIALPTALAIWGDATVTEYLQVVYNEENEPGVTHTTSGVQFPAGVTYNVSTRTVTVNITSGKTGRLNFILSSWKAGATGEPLRFAVNVGPVINVGSLSYTAGQVVSLDLYPLCDCGVLTSNGVSRVKTINVTGLTGSGLSYDATTSILSGTFVAGTYSINVSASNSLGQSSSKNINVTTKVASAYESWTGTGWFDAATEFANITSGTLVSSFTNKRTGKGDLTAGGTLANIVVSAILQNGNKALSLSRDVSTLTSVPRLSSVSTSLLSQTFQGTNKPYTVISVYVPIDTNTSFIWTSSATVDATNVENIALVRRNATASSVRKQLVNATPNDVNFGAGQAVDAVKIVAVKHTGTAVSIWDTSLTPVVNGTAQSTTAFSVNNVFRLFASSVQSATAGNFAQTQGNLRFFEIVIEDSAHTDAEVQQAISDLANKWGVILA